VRTLVEATQADIMCIHETKIANMPQQVLLSALGSSFTDYLELLTMGASGGILVAWRRHVQTTGSRQLDTNSSSIQFCSENGVTWWLTCIYGPQGNDEKIAFLQELRDIKSACNGPWVLDGDFNLIFKDEDKNNANCNRAMMGRFKRLIDDLALKEIPLHGRHFTWSNHQEFPTLVKLDRVLCTVDWEVIFPNCLLQSMATNDSDHCPLVLGLEDNHLGRRRFHFENFWPQVEGFQEAVEVAWNSVPTAPCSFFSLDAKIKALTRGLQSWSDKTVGNVNFQLALACEILHQLEIANDFRVLAVGEMWLKNSLKKHSFALASLKRTIARSRSHISWLQKGDANTKLFHLHARHRKRKNFIAKLTLGGHIYTGHEDKAQVVDQFYDELLGRSINREHTINLQELGIPSHNLADLELPFIEDEVWLTIKKLPADKAPGLDGLTSHFYKCCWSIIKKDIMTAISWVWSRKMIGLTPLSTAYITLLPKKEEAEEPKDFKPISLVHSFAKLLTKMMANRLASRLSQMVSPNQSAFIKWRFIQDNFMLVQQTARFLHQQKQPRILLKLDISKAFDSVAWPFLLEVLHHIGFGPIWRDIISGLLCSSSTQVLLNGSPGQRIFHRRGLR
jgi:exonuclease III